MKKPLVQFNSVSESTDFPGVTDLDPREFSTKLESAHIVDVRRPDEYTGELGHIAGAQLIVLDTLPQYISELPKDEPIVFVCRSGGRSTRAAAFALGQGFTHVYNLKGGMLLWNELKLPTEK